MTTSENAGWAISLDDVYRAADRIAPHAVQTPALNSPALDDELGVELWFKAETHQVTGSFKFRGACNALAALNNEQRRAGVVAWSSGNHGQAVAAAAVLHDSSAVIVMPTDAPELKVKATAARGARIVHYDRYREDRIAVGQAIADNEGRTAIPPYDAANVIAGQGTAMLEFVDQAPELDAMFVCLGGGGLLAGSATVASKRSPATALFGVEPATGDDHQQSRHAGRRVEIAVPRTIADGQQTTAPGALTWPITNALATDFLTVTDDEICKAMALLHRHFDLIVEPSGASAFAAVIGAEPQALVDGRIGVTISGGNIAPERHDELIAPWR